MGLYSFRIVNMYNKLFFLVLLSILQLHSSLKTWTWASRNYQEKRWSSNEICVLQQGTLKPPRFYKLIVNWELFWCTGHLQPVRTLILLAWSSSEQLGSVRHTCTFYFLIRLCLQQMWSVLCGLMHGVWDFWLLTSQKHLDLVWLGFLTKFLIYLSSLCPWEWILCIWWWDL